MHKELLRVAPWEQVCAFDPVRIARGVFPAQVIHIATKSLVGVEPRDASWSVLVLPNIGSDGCTDRSADGVCSSKHPIDVNGHR